MKKVKGFKGFDKNLKCRGMQYHENGMHAVDGEIVLCGNGLHFCNNPLDVLTYYPPCSGVQYREVEASGNVILGNDKSVTNKLRLLTTLSISKLFKIQFELIKADVKKSTDSNTSGDRAHANTSGDESHANTSGYRAHANTSGHRAHANTSGDESHANTSGYESISCAIGIESRACAVNGWIVIVDWRYSDKWHINDIHKAKVGDMVCGVKIEPSVSYWFKAGKLISDSNLNENN